VRKAGPQLKRKALFGQAQLALLMGLALFVPGGLRYLEGWVFLSVFVLCSLAITLHLIEHDPALLERRLKAGPGAEQRTQQKWAQLCASLAFFGTLVLCAVDHRGAWSHLAWPLVVLGDLLVAFGFGVVWRVFRENTFASALIELRGEQRVIDSGPYAWVRHPMYAGVVVLVAGIPLALGSLWGLMALPPFVGLIIWRLLDEEVFLSARLPGYAAYCQRTQYRLLPGVW
jgi:protein-S-isoprenylcysteine O-methyltransferase Ste14